ncbi:hypothetical protein BCR34DRAFT_606696 [Clohesyomyces aquaticus]|uniref:F-box domain-containing protein n=1 Tax=Clohesyomyces aquaticus TaxID=1231657 RepID=A0A1Y1YNS0_9PLEO|nr:hypothetical protein BCR34DRAFT_606696 [Clohesyomyces aquaticus]
MLQVPSRHRSLLSVDDVVQRDFAPRAHRPSRPESSKFSSSFSSTVASSRPTSASAGSTRSWSSSVSSYSSVFGVGFDVPHLIRTPWELERNNKKNSASQRSKPDSVFPAHVFKKLPREVYDCILAQLKQIHFGQNAACPSCYLRDLHNLTLTSRAWDRAATRQMYRNWDQSTQASSAHPSRTPGTGAIRPRATYAGLPDPVSECQYRKEEIVNLVASVVMACPNLERLVGFHVPFTHAFDRLSHALSTRTKLKECMWILSADDTEPDSDEEDDANNMYYHPSLDVTERFLHLNSNHPNLTTLVLYQQSRPSTPLTFRAIIGTLRQFPSLCHLSISNLPASSFTNLALNALPLNLESLRLENLPGINDKGLQRFGTSQASTTLKSLTLINLEISSLVTLSNFLRPELSRLSNLTFVQHKSPSLPSSSEIPTPFFSSPSLRSLHWEITSQACPTPTLSSPFSTPPSSQPPPSTSQPGFPFPNEEPLSCLGTNILATSLKSGFFPSLRQIRIPHDPQGLIQGLCKPRATALIPDDTRLLLSRPRDSVMSNSTFSSAAKWSDPRIDSPFPSPGLGKPTLYEFPPPPPMTTTGPAQSRLAAQARILIGRRTPFMTFRVTDPEGRVLLNKTVYGFLGKLDSRIVYEVKPDRTRAPERDSAINGDILRMRLADADAEGYGDWIDGLEGGRTGSGSDWITSVEDVTGEAEEVGGGQVLGCRHFGRGVKRIVRVKEMF